MAFIVVYDACVLHDSLLRDLLIRLARKRKLNLQARWSEPISMRWFGASWRDALISRPIGWPVRGSSCAMPSPTAS